MSRLPKDREREELELEIEDKEYMPFLERLQRKHPFYRDFSAWDEVIAFMREGSSKDPLKDEVLRPILGAHARDGDPHWRTILLVIFWPGLKSICIQRRGWDPEFEELWANAVWVFLHGVCRLDLAKRSDRLVQKLINDTASRLRQEYRRQRNRASTEIATDPELIEVLMGGAEDPGFLEMDLREQLDLQVRRFRQHLDAGRIGEVDFNLLVGTRVYGKLLRECAEEAGLSYQAAKKRRQRAEAAIRRAEES